MSGDGSQQPEVTCHNAEECDFQGISDLCALEGWNTSPQDVRLLCSFLPEANQVARSGGKTVGLCIATPLDDKEAFVCLMAIHKVLQRKGIGSKLFERSLAALGDRNVSLYASPAGVPFYRRYGFQSAQQPTYLYQTKFYPIRDGLNGTPDPEGVRIVPLSQVNFDDLIAYDTDVHRIKREEWIKPLVALPDSLAVLDDNNKIVGFAGVEQYPKEYTQIKPLLADTAEVAAMVVKSIIKVTPKGHKVKVKLLSENPEAISLMEKIGFSSDIKPPDMIMFNKHKFEVKARKVFSVMNGWNQFA